MGNDFKATTLATDKTRLSTPRLTTELPYLYGHTPESFNFLQGFNSFLVTRKMFMCHGEEGSGDAHTPHLSVFRNLVDIQEEMELVDEECFCRTTARHALEHITLEEYFDRLIDHIREGGARHTWDKSNSNIAHILQVDLIAGAFKHRMLGRHLGRISHAGKARGSADRLTLA